MPDWWQPEDIARHVASMSTFDYCVVDEIVGDMALLIISPWPAVDEADRRVFIDPEGPDLDLREGGRQETYFYREIAVTVSVLQRFLDTNRATEDAEQRVRAVRIGDVFAVREGFFERLALPPDWDPGPSDRPLIDVTTAARAAAEVAFSRIIAPPEAGLGGTTDDGVGNEPYEPVGGEYAEAATEYASFAPEAEAGPSTAETGWQQPFELGEAT